VIRFGALGVVSALTFCLYSGEPRKTEELLSFEEFHESLDRNPIPDNHDYALVVDGYLRQLGRLEGKKDLSAKERELMKTMASEEKLRWLLDLTKIRADLIKENPDASLTRKADLQLLANTRLFLEKRVASKNVPPVGPALKGVSPMPGSDTKLVSKEEAPSILAFLKRLHERLEKGQFELLLNEDFAVARERASPHMTKELEHIVKSGGLRMIQDLQKSEDCWFQIKDDVEPVVLVNFRKSGPDGYLSLSKKNGIWKFYMIKIGELSESVKRYNIQVPK